MLYTPETLEETAAPKSKDILQTLFLDFDLTLTHLGGNDYLPTILYGGEKTVELLRELKEKGVFFAIATNKHKEAAKEILPFLKANSLDDIIDFIVYEKCQDDKFRMLNACKKYYSKNNKIEKNSFVFLDDHEPNCDTAKKLGMKAIYLPMLNESMAKLESVECRGDILIQAIKKASNFFDITLSKNTSAFFENKNKNKNKKEEKEESETTLLIKKDKKIKLCPTKLCSIL